MQLNKANKVVLAILVIAICAAFVSCSAKPPEAATAAAEQATPAPTEAAAAAESTPTPAPTVQPTEAPTPAVEAVTPTVTPAAAEAAQAAPANNPAEQAAAVPSPTAGPAEAQAAPTVPAAQESSFKGALSEPIAEQPAYLTSIGQSADVQMVKTLLTRAEIKFDFSVTAKAEEITGKTLVLAVGGSSKGLGAAGIKAEDELVRAAEIVKAAKDKGMTVISVHVGGEARRGELSDKFIKEVVPYSDYIIVVEDGNKDGLFDKLANGIPMDTVKKITAVVDPLKAAFK